LEVTFAFVPLFE